MPIGQGIIFNMASVTGASAFGYTWKDDIGQEDVDTIVTGKTKAQAYNEVGALLLAMPGSVKRVEIMGISS